MKIFKTIKEFFRDMQDLDVFADKYRQYISSIALTLTILGLIYLLIRG